jgi:copper transport protein
MIGCAVVVMVTLLCLVPASASAHTEFESSDPAGGWTLAEQPTAITLRFTEEAEIVGDGVRLLDADAAVVPADVEQSSDGTVITVRPLRALDSGRYGVQWNVAGTDGHPLSGSFQFRLQLRSTPATSTSIERQLVSNTTALTTSAETQTETTTVSTAPTSSTASTVSGEVSSPPTSGDPLTEVLASENGSPSGAGWAAIGRSVLIFGVLIVLGAMAVSNFVVSDVEDRITILRWARWAALPIIAGTVIDVLGQAGAIGGVTDSLDDVLSDWLGVAAALRLVGACGLLLLVRKQQVASSTGVPPLMLIPAALLVLSFSFDGHTVSRGFPPLHAMVNIVHVTAASVWAGSVIVVAALIAHRIRSGRPSDVLVLAVRLSSISTISLGALFIAGVLLSIIVVNSFDDLLETEWGLTLLLKVAAVAVSLSFAVYNRFTLLPRLQAAPADRRRRVAVRATLTAEAIVMVLVIVATAWLVAAQT